MPTSIRKNWKLWFKGLAVAAISGASNAGALMMIDPQTFNLNDGLPKLLKMSLALAISHTYLYLRKSPIPWAEEVKDAE
jgi:hypothetical protein